MGEVGNNKRFQRFWLCITLPVAALLAVLLGVSHLRQMKESHIRSGRIQLVGALKEWDQAGRPEGEALADSMQMAQDPRGYFATNAVLAIEGKQIQTIFATTRIGTPGVLMVTTNYEFILFQPWRAPRLLK